MLKTLFRDRVFILLFLLSALLKLFSLNENWVESIYSTGFYPVLSKLLRTVFGWIPFSIGDLVYILAFVWLVYKTWRMVQRVKRRKTGDGLSWHLFSKYAKLALLIYVHFSINWGLNYNRLGIRKQVGLQLSSYTSAELLSVTASLRDRLVALAPHIDSLQRLRYSENRFLFSKGAEAYRSAAATYPFLAYSPQSIKPSLFTPIANLVGFTGYFNPFSAEAQLKTSIPVFLKPFVVAHEMAHQVGYAKENEASFVAYLACKTSTDSVVLYSTYFELYRDAVAECAVNNELRDSVQAWQKTLPPRVQYDRQELRLYLQRERNFVEPFMSEAYDRYLRINNQPNGKATYNEVIAYLIAYAKKYGLTAI